MLPIAKHKVPGYTMIFGLGWAFYKFGEITVRAKLGDDRSFRYLKA